MLYLLFKGLIYVFNLTRFPEKELIIEQASGPFIGLLMDIKKDQSSIANELLEKIKELSKQGPIPATVAADTAVGRSLETALGININSSKKPDYKGIEIKSFRSKRTTRNNLFAQVPDWGLSKFKSSKEILENFGYIKDGILQLYCTVKVINTNTQGLRLRIETVKNINDLLIEYSSDTSIGDFVVWDMAFLQNRLIEKHKETFWISADSEFIDGIEHFIYKKIIHTRNPIINQFGTLLNNGTITLDHLIEKDSNGKVTEKGPLFKITKKGIGQLFPPSREYTLSK